MSPLANACLYQACWFLAVLGATSGRGWLGPLAALTLVSVCLASARRPRRMAQFLLLSLVLGACAETLLAVTGLVQSEVSATSSTRALPALWLITLWPAFATTLGSSLAILSRRPLLAATFGAVGGPLAYAAGDALGAISLGEPTWLVLGSLSLLWAFIVPGLSHLSASWVVAATKPRSRPFPRSLEPTDVH